MPIIAAKNSSYKYISTPPHEKKNKQTKTNHFQVVTICMNILAYSAWLASNHIMKDGREQVGYLDHHL